MVEISLSGSGGGPGKATTRGYPTLRLRAPESRVPWPIRGISENGTKPSAATYAGSSTNRRDSTTVPAALVSSHSCGNWAPLRSSSENASGTNTIRRRASELAILPANVTEKGRLVVIA